MHWQIHRTALVLGSLGTVCCAHICMLPCRAGNLKHHEYMQQVEEHICSMHAIHVYGMCTAAHQLHMYHISCSHAALCARSKRAILNHALVLRDLEPLLSHIHDVIEEILAERRVSYMSTKCQCSAPSSVSNACMCQPCMQVSTAIQCIHA